MDQQVTAGVHTLHSDQTLEEILRAGGEVPLLNQCVGAGKSIRAARRFLVLWFPWKRNMEERTYQMDTDTFFPLFIVKSD